MTPLDSNPFSRVNVERAEADGELEKKYNTGCGAITKPRSPFAAYRCWSASRVEGTGCTGIWSEQRDC